MEIPIFTKIIFNENHYYQRTQLKPSWKTGT